MLDTLGRIAATPAPVVDRLRRRYQRRYEAAQHILDQIADRYPDWITDMQERLARRVLLDAEADAIARQAERGTLPPPVAERLARPSQTSCGACKGTMSQSSSWSRSRWSSGCPGFRTSRRQTWPTSPSACSCSSFPSIRASSGKVRPATTCTSSPTAWSGYRGKSKAPSRDLATLKAGEFFGETALLSAGQLRNATVTAVTPCTLYRLHRDDLRIAMDMQPAIRRVLEQESQRRAAAYDGA